MRLLFGCVYGGMYACLNACMCAYIYIYIRVCMCVCGFPFAGEALGKNVCDFYLAVYMEVCMRV